ncbi:aminopeptidase [Flavobacterium noncentrifugens]|uniref:Aminopeptidase n=1 Tax=Flavobacterium noncentrifugens TaxID=1128970 RepID=A0A1G8W4J8_9FLAO|nr:C1 family peptidase [Flavobacterium noncentrifugens]GEP50771.1 aminopeptidase [Flavobacterium noncentrifugens]SDJ73202.1 bleomycin hydrolase [Flavobacterium noncentrifugens]
MIRKSLLLTGMFCSLSLFAQDELIKKVINNASLSSKFEFKNVIDLETTSVKNQGSAGTCWSYSGNSFLESEMIRMGKQPVDLAEVYSARQVYLSKARNYILFNGNMGLGDGGETHDVMNMLRKYGAMPQVAYTYEDYGKGTLKAGDFQDKFKAILDAYIKNPDPKKGVSWVSDINNYMDEKLGKLPATFKYNGKDYNPHTFAKEVIGINPDDYVEFSSYKDSPYYQKMVLPVPDNWSYDQLYNVPMKELTDIIDNALAKGFTVAWSSDVSEPYFSWRNGVAQVPNLDDLYNITDEQKKTIFDGPIKEKDVTEDLRLEGLYSLYTTDDHAMQIVGLVKDQNGKEYYKVKNSWGASNDYKGYLYVTKAFVQLKSTGILLNKGGLPKNIKSKLHA